MLSTCAEGQHKYAVNICQKIFTLEELVRLVYNSFYIIFIYINYTVLSVIQLCHLRGRNHLVDCLLELI